jgi:hypothetical protein
MSKDATGSAANSLRRVQVWTQESQGVFCGSDTGCRGCGIGGG